MFSLQNEPEPALLLAPSHSRCAAAAPAGSAPAQWQFMRVLLHHRAAAHTGEH